MSKPLKSKSKILITALGVFFSSTQLNAQNNNAPQIMDFSPERYSMQNSSTVSVYVQFDVAMDDTTFLPETFLVQGEKTGFHAGTITYDSTTKTVTFEPLAPFQAGEMVTVVLTQGITNKNGKPLASSFQWSFYIQTSTGTATFELDSAYTTGKGPHFVGIGELNGDSGLDLAIPHSISHDTHTWLNMGSGIFDKNNIIGVGTQPRSLTIGDFDSDGDLDLAVPSELRNWVTIINNDGAGNFVARDTTLTVSEEPTHISNADLNGDGFLDLITVNKDSNSISVLLNLGDGNFQPQVEYPVGQVPQSSFIADFTNNGFMDIVVTNSVDSSISLLKNDSTGAFKPPENFMAGREPRAVSGQDFNGDGSLDLAVANRASNTISILFNTGGAFSQPTYYAVGTDPVAMTAGDWDGDFDADLAVTQRISNELYILLNDGSGNFQIDSIYATGLQPRNINSGDFNGDGVLDLAVVNWESNTFQVFFNTLKQNQAPGTPNLLSPDDLSFVNPDLTGLTLNWSVPNDPDNDSLHFMIEIDQSPDFTSPSLVFDSRTDVTGFTPTPPVDQSITSMSFNITEPIQDGLYWWRVFAWDGQALGIPSDARRFIVDSTPPNIDTVTVSTPDLQPNWYNQNNTAAINFEVQYDEMHAQKAEFNLGALGGVQTNESISSGLDQTVQVSVNISGVADGSYPLSVAVFDSAGNQTGDTTEIALDATPPSGAQAKSPAISAEESFSVSWGGTATDGNGSGISGFYTIRVQIDDGPWQNWLTNFEGTSAVYAGAQGHTYGFEAAAHDNLGNVEPFVGVAETATLVDTTATDVTAPDPPLTLTAGGSNPSPWQNNPEFQINWQAPPDPSGIARALFKLGDSPTADFDTTGSVTASSSTSVKATQEDGQNFYLWFEDNKGNVNFQNNAFVQLRYDKTVPAIIGINILNVDLEPNWFNQRKTQTAQVTINYSEKHLRWLLLESVDLDTTIQVQQVVSGDNISVRFDLNIQGKPDGDYALAFTLIDSAGNRKQDSTERIALDSTPPTGAEASSPQKSTTESFVVSWGGTATDGDGSGISGIYDVRVQIDGGAWENWLADFEGTSAEFQGAHGKTYGFEAAAHDNLGNVESFLEVPESVTVVDTGFVDVSPPTIFHTPETLVDQGQGIDIQSQIQDNIQVTEVLLFYRQGGKTEFQTMAMADLGGGTYQATLSSEQISTRGINYFIRASDGFSFSYHPTENWDTNPNNISVRILGTDNQGLLKENPQPGGSEQVAFRMISVPLNLSDPRPKLVLEDDLGPYDPKQWRFFQYNPLTEEYSEFPNTDSFSPGKAFWLIVREANKQIDSGVGTTVATNQPFQITLKQGWNDISNPFTFPVKWSDVDVVQGSPDDIMGPYTFNGGWLLPNQVTTLFAWEGYSIYSNTQGAVISINPIEAGNQMVPTLHKNLDEIDWYVKIEAVCEEARDGSNFIGVSTAALPDWDKLDYLEPPYLGEYVSLRFPHDEWHIFRGAFTTDYRPPYDDGQVWHFKVQTNISNAPITVNFENLESLPSNFRAILLDLSTFQQTDIQQESQYDFVPDHGSLTREFDLIIGTDSYLQDSDLINETKPEAFSLSQNYPNPFNAGTNLVYQIPEFSHVSIKVLNVLGQEVRQLISQSQQPGVYRVHWDGKSEDGKDTGSGIYLIRLEAGQFQQSRKVLLIR